MGSVDEEVPQYDDDVSEPGDDDEDEAQPAKKKRRGRGGKRKMEDKLARPPVDSIGRSILTAKMKKTRMCDFHAEGRCKYGSECAFAHDPSELQDAPDLKKTRLCRAFLQGKCQVEDCKFAHGEHELRASDICFKTALCTWYAKGKCQSGAQCRFAHGEHELRDDPDAQAAIALSRKRKADEDDRRGSRHSSVCHRCGSTIATGLGIVHCVLCRF
eukprot:TRINITY_DN85465_c0_g1_i1.p1 TRINITY_DN85465_c0_g1~~TRINITY_DN85465_c0_g1_i1.p1  ORF type:complete len:215 (+),score=36.69 TRINITY_DN85465_c0_g1_i1:62-706(+)